MVNDVVTVGKKPTSGEVFVLNLRAAAKKAGSARQLMLKLEGSLPTYYNWLRTPPKKDRGSALALKLSEYLGMANVDQLFEEISPLVDKQEEQERETNMSEVERVLQVMNEIRETRKKYTWATIQMWVGKVREWAGTLPSGSVDDLLTIVENMAPAKTEAVADMAHAVDEK
jgi:hypothetical protein